MSILSTDTFIRANQSGWGTASDGETWATVAGSPTLAIATNQGNANTAALTDAVMLLGSKTTASINYLIRLKIAEGNGGAVWRYQNASNYYRVVCETGTVYLQKRVAGSNSTITSAAGTFTAETWLRVVSNTTDIAVTVWADGSSEPGTPTLSATDSAFTSAGQYGVSDVSYSGSGTNLFDHLTVTDNQSAMPLITQTQVKFSVKANLQTQARSNFLVRLKLGTQAQAKFLVRLVLKTQSEAKFFVRSLLQTQARAKFLIRLKLATQARAKFVIRLALKTQARSKFLINQIINPLKQFKISFLSKNKLKISFVSRSKYNVKFSEAAMVLPNSTTQSSATVTDANNNPQAALTGNITVYFPDGTSSGPLSPSNAGAGVYTLTYTTKGPGLHRELWSFSDGSGNVLTDYNIIPCDY